MRTFLAGSFSLPIREITESCSPPSRQGLTAIRATPHGPLGTTLVRGSLIVSAGVSFCLEGSVQDLHKNTPISGSVFMYLYLLLLQDSL